MAPSLDSKNDEGGDDLGTTDEVRVFKDEGDFEEEKERVEKEKTGDGRFGHRGDSKVEERVVFVRARDEDRVEVRTKGKD